MNGKPKLSDFMRSSGAVRSALDLPTLVVTKKAKSAVSTTTKRKVAYGVESLDRLVEAFDENEREISR